MTDIDDLQKHQHFVAEMEQAIRIANREVINPILPPITHESVLPLAIAVAKLRARYLEAAFKLGGDDFPSDEKVAEVGRHKIAYVETRDAFDALMLAIERGYVDLAD